MPSHMVEILTLCPRKWMTIFAHSPNSLNEDKVRHKSDIFKILILYLGYNYIGKKPSRATVLLKVVTNEKRGELRSWQVFEDGTATGPWRSMSVYFLMLLSSFLRSISVSCL
jgi:hypothetical protein